MEVDSYLANETKGASDGLEFISPEFYGSSFINKFEEEYGHKPGIPAGQAYDATNILISFLEEHEEPEEILQKMEQFTNYKGASGDIVITSDHKTLLPTAIFKLNQGSAQKIEQ